MATRKKLEDENIVAEEKAAEIEPADDRVEIMIPFIDGEDPEITVGINGVFTKIRRGVLVKVPKPVAEVISNANQQMIVSRANREKFKKQSMDL